MVFCFAGRKCLDTTNSKAREIQAKASVRHFLRALLKGVASKISPKIFIVLNGNRRARAALDDGTACESSIQRLAKYPIVFFDVSSPSKRRSQAYLCGRPS